MKHSKGYNILPDLMDAVLDAKKGQLSPYWQRRIMQECEGEDLTPQEQTVLERLHEALENVPQWTDEEALCAEIAGQGGRVLFCHFFQKHNSFAEVTQDKHGLYSIATLIDCALSPDERKEVAHEMQSLLAEQMESWNVRQCQVLIPEKGKYGSLQHAASALMQMLGQPESVCG